MAGRLSKGRTVIAIVASSCDKSLNRTIVLKQRLASRTELRMDLNFTPEELAFREKVRGWVAEHLPKDISYKVHNALRLSRDDMQRWAKIRQAGLAGWGWPKEFGGRVGTRSSAICSKRNARSPAPPRRRSGR
jgi:hypothetical protein